MATVVYREDRDCWEVRWAEQVITATSHTWKWRRKSCRTQTIAKQLARQIEDAAALGQRWQESASMRQLAVDWIAASQANGHRAATTRHRASLLESWLAWWGDRPLPELSLVELERYQQSLPGAGRAAATRHRKILVVEQLWRWGWDRRSAYPGLPQPSRLTGPGGALPPAPVVATAAPTWADVDAMIGHLLQPWHRQAALLMRYGGLRAGQVCGLEWRDLDLDRGTLHLRASVRGAKGQRSRVVPLSPALVASLRQWERPAEGGLLFPRRYRDTQGQPRSGPHRPDALIEPFRRAWSLSGVPESRWGVDAAVAGSDQERAHASPSHAIRRCLRTELLRLGVEEPVVLYLVGHTAGHTAAAYVPEVSPEASPWWPRLVAAVALIPPHTAATPR